MTTPNSTIATLAVKDMGIGRPSIKTVQPGKHELRQAAEQFEAMFLRQILEEGHKTQLSDDLFGSRKDDNFQSMLDNEYAQSAAGSLDLGIADVLYEQFVYALPKEGK